jgi:hypothetical protein
VPLESETRRASGSVVSLPLVRSCRETLRGSTLSEQIASREVAVARLHVARERRDQQTGRYEVARGSPAELAAYAELQEAVDQFAAREAWLAWLDRGY